MIFNSQGACGGTMLERSSNFAKQDKSVDIINVELGLILVVMLLIIRKYAKPN